MASARERITVFDTLRGLTIISMVAFHASYDAAYIYGYSLPWFTGTLFQDVWRASISWTFLALAGWMTAFSRSNFKRAALYGAAAALVWIATTVVAVDTPVSFGILFCMAASTLICAAARPLLDRVHPALGLVASLAAFVATLQVPHARYPFDGLAWLGFPGSGFSSGDYYPLVPYAFMYLAGSFGACLFGKLRGQGYPSWMKRDYCPPLTAVGRASLPIYLVHQVVLIVVFGAIAAIAP